MNKTGGRMLKKYLIKILTFLTFFSLTYQAQAESFKIGLSNGWVGSEWRTQMIDEAKEAAAAWAGEGVEIEVLVQSANVDVPGQIAHVKNFISQGVDAIIINPNSAARSMRFKLRLPNFTNISRLPPRRFFLFLLFRFPSFSAKRSNCNSRNT